MKILVLCYEYPPIGGGGGVICQYISEGLAKHGHKITLVTTWLEGLSKKEGSDNFRIIRVKSLRKNNYRSNPFEMLSWIKHSKMSMNQLCESERFDLCFAHFVVPGGEVARYLKMKLGIPFVVMSHGHDVPWVRPYSMYFYHAIAYPFIKKICKLSEVNFVQTREMKTNIDRFTGRRFSKKNILIPNGCDINSFSLKSRELHDEMNITFSGRLVAQKDPFTLLRAIKLLQGTAINFKLHIYGDGPLRNKIEHFIRSNSMDNCVSLYGKVSTEVMKTAYSHADLLVSSSLSEGMSITILEAMASGIYVLVTPASGNPNLVTEGVDGELFNFSDFSELAEKIKRYYSDKFVNAYKIPDSHLTNFRLKYNWKGIVDQYNTIIKSLPLS